MKLYYNLLSLLLILLVSCASNAGYQKAETPEIAPVIQIAADVDRNGEIDFPADEIGEESWSRVRGAMFMNNNDSDQDSGRPDHADDLFNGPEDLKDLAKIRIRCIGALPENSQINVTLKTTHPERVRLFYKNSEGNLIASKGEELTLKPPSPDQDIELRMEANSYADQDWNGEVLVTAEIQMPEGAESSDSVLMRAAPFLLLSNSSPVETVYVREFPGRNDKLISQLREIIPEAGANLHVIPECGPYKYNHISCQDAMDIGFTEMPGVEMNVVLNSNRNKSLDHFPENDLLGPDYGWFRCGDFRPEYGRGDWGDAWLDWFGNLEVTPPIPGYPLGRIYYGTSGDASLNPEIVNMLNAQNMQGPALGLDAGWLLIKHVDEMLMFVPSGEKGEHKLLVADPASMVEILKKWMDEGKGDMDLLEPYEEDLSIADLAEDQNLISHNLSLQKNHIEPNIEKMKNEFGIKESDIIRIPTLFKTNGQSIAPNMVNSAVFNGYLLISDPFGPRDSGGNDLLKEEVMNLLGEIPLEIRFVDDRQYHKWSGNIHCATNARRSGFEEEWWNLLGD